MLHRRLPYALAGLLQIVGMAIIGGVLTLPVPLVWPLLQSVLDRFGIDAALASVCVIYHVIGLLMCSFAIILRRLLFLLLPMGPGQCEVNSPLYLSWWFASRLVSVTYPVYMSHMRGTIVHTWWLRALGARIGKDVRLSRGVVLTDPDMTILHNGSVLGKCRLVGSVVRDGVLTRGIVEVGEGAQVCTHAIMQPGSTLAEGSVLQPLSVASEGQQLLPAHAVFEGAPASFLHPRSTFVARPNDAKTISQILVGIFVFLVKATWGPLAAAFSARAIYPLTVLVFTRCRILKFFVWRLFHEGILLGALYTCIGLVPMLGIPILKAWWTVREYVYLFPDAVIEHMLSKLYGGRAPVSVELFREMLGSPEWLEVVRRSMPEGIQLVGEAGDPHLMTVSSGRVVRSMRRCRIQTHRHRPRRPQSIRSQTKHTHKARIHREHTHTSPSPLCH
jgi:acetyltransferase-like isoleucine patch superfamily enzyme